MDLQNFMGFLTSISGNLNYAMIGGVSAAFLVSLGGYKIFTLKKKQDLIKSVQHDNSDFLNASLQVKHSDSENEQIMQTITEYDDQRPNANVPRNEQLLEEAKVFDALGRKTEAIKSLHKALVKSKDEETLNKIQQIIKKYEQVESSVSLESIIDMFEQDIPILTKKVNADIPTLTEKVEEVGEIPDYTPKFDLFESLKQQADAEDIIKQKENEEASQQFLEAFSNKMEKEMEAFSAPAPVQKTLAIVHEEQPLPVKEAVPEVIKIPDSQPKQEITQTNVDTSYEVWVNWMQNDNGKNTFKNGYFRLRCTWGTKAAILELHKSIVKDAPKENFSIGVLSVFVLDK